MKRQFGILVCLLLTATLLISGCSNQTETVTEDPTAAQEQAVTEDLETLLAPYQAVMDKVNEELGSQFAIRKGYEASVYDAYQDYTLEEFEAYLRESYAEINAASSAEETELPADGQLIRADATDLETLLAPYQEVMDKVNEELGSQFAIREGYESIVYDAYQDYTLEEFEAYLRESYAEINAASSADAAQSALDRQFTRSER